MIFEENGWRVFIDIAKTSHAYELLKSKNQKGVICDCKACKNVNLLLKGNLFPSYILDTCSMLGINHEIPGEFYLIEQTRQTLVYHGFYSLYGEILHKPEIYDKVWFEEHSPLGTPNFPKDPKTILLGVHVELDNIVGTLD